MAKTSHRGLSATMDKYMAAGLNKVYHIINVYSCMCLKVITHLGQIDITLPPLGVWLASGKWP